MSDTSTIISAIIMVCLIFIAFSLASIANTLKENKDMEVEVLINIVDDISCELERIRETDGAEEEEEWFQDNLVEAHDLLLKVKDLIGA